LAHTDILFQPDQSACALLTEAQASALLQALDSQSSDSALGHLQSLGADADRFATEHLSAQVSRAQYVAAGSAAASSAGAGEALRVSAAAAAATAGSSEALDGALQQLQAAAGAREHQHVQPKLPIRTELDVSSLACLHLILLCAALQAGLAPLHGCALTQCNTFHHAQAARTCRSASCHAGL
jgi:hypothetical protein